MDIQYDELPGSKTTTWHDFVPRFEKAFDALDWQFMFKVLKAYGFGDNMLMEKHILQQY